jgi:hypothetical protein
MAKAKKWTVETAKQYLMKNDNNKGLTYWSVHDFLVRVGVLKG